jgi:hypothetical protein
MIRKNALRFCHITPDFGRPPPLVSDPGSLSNDLPLLGKVPSTSGPFLSRAAQSISLDEGARRLPNTDEESSMTRQIESYRYELQHSDDADFVAYQRKSSNGAWQTVSVWMIPQPTGR